MKSGFDCIAASPIKAALLGILLLLATLSESLAEDKRPHVREFQRGVQLTREEKYLDALRAFQRSREIKPTSSALFNIGMCYKALFRYVESVDTLKEYLLHPKAKPLETEDAKEAIAEMEKLIGHLTISVSPEGAEIQLNGRSVGMAPLKDPIRVDPKNSYALRVSKDGFVPFTKDVYVENGAKMTVPVTLEPETSTLKITCRDPEARIRIDDREVTVPCPYEEEMSPGEHTVEVSAPNRIRRIESVQVFQGETAMLTVPLLEKEPEPVATPTVPPPPVQATDPRPVEEKGSPAVLAKGAVIATLGVAGAVVGAVFTSKYNDAVETGTAAANQWNLNHDESDRIVYNQAAEDMESYKPGIVAGFVCGGVLLTTGVVLIGIGVKERRHPRRAHVAPEAGGVTVRF